MADSPRPNPDDDDWVRRDLGPRPKVPNHGARPFLMGLPILLITVAAVVAILVAGCGDNGDDGDSAGSPQTAGAADAQTKKVVAGLRDAGQQLAGRADLQAFADLTCEPTDGADFRCNYGGGGGPEAGVVRARLQDDGTVTKILGPNPPTPGSLKASAATQELLAADDELSGAPAVKYLCATSTPVNPDGSSTGANSSGQLCLLRKGSDDTVVGQRYVDFATDGTARHDFMVDDGS